MIPIAADTIADALGVNTHTQNDGTAYTTLPLASLLTGLRVRHVRETIDAGAAYQQTRKANLSAAAAVKFTLCPTPPPASAANVISAIASIASSVEGIEGLNEWDIKGPSSTWLADDKAYQLALYNAAKANTATAAIPVLAPSIGYPETSEASLGDISDRCDVANGHFYPGGRPPSQGDSSLDNRLALVKATAPGKPVWVTETGYHNAVSTTNGHLPADEATVGVYAPRSLLEYVSRGIQRMFLYELLDEKTDTANTNVENHFGLVRFDGTLKPAYTALARLMALVSDIGAAPSLTQLNATVAGPADLRTLLAQRGDGTWLLFLWRDVSVWDRTNRTKTNVPAADTVVTLPSTATASKLTRITSGIESTVSTNTVTVPLDGELVCLTILPAPRTTVARFRFGGTGSDFAFRTKTSGSDKVMILAATTVTCWSAETGGTKYLVSVNGVDTTDVPVTSNGRIPVHYGPPGVTEMWWDWGLGYRLRAPSLDRDALKGEKGEAGDGGATGAGSPSTGVPAAQTLAGVQAVWTGGKTMTDVGDTHVEVTGGSITLPARGGLRGGVGTKSQADNGDKGGWIRQNSADTPLIVSRPIVNLTDDPTGGHLLRDLNLMGPTAPGQIGDGIVYAGDQADFRRIRVNGFRDGIRLTNKRNDGTSIKQPNGDFWNFVENSVSRITVNAFTRYGLNIDSQDGARVTDFFVDGLVSVCSAGKTHLFSTNAAGGEFSDIHTYGQCSGPAIDLGQLYHASLEHAYIEQGWGGGQAAAAAGDAAGAGIAVRLNFSGPADINDIRVDTNNVAGQICFDLFKHGSDPTGPVTIKMLWVHATSDVDVSAIRWNSTQAPLVVEHLVISGPYASRVAPVFESGNNDAEQAMVDIRKKTVEGGEPSSSRLYNQRRRWTGNGAQSMVFKIPMRQYQSFVGQLSIFGTSYAQRTSSAAEAALADYFGLLEVGTFKDKTVGSPVPARLRAVAAATGMTTPPAVAAVVGTGAKTVDVTLTFTATDTPGSVNYNAEATLVGAIPSTV